MQLGVLGLLKINRSESQSNLNKTISFEKNRPRHSQGLFFSEGTVLFKQDEDADLYIISRPRTCEVHLLNTLLLSNYQFLAIGGSLNIMNRRSCVIVLGPFGNSCMLMLLASWPTDQSEAFKFKWSQDYFNAQFSLVQYVQVDVFAI